MTTIDQLQHRLAVIGFDGATFDLIQPWVAEGKLPTLERIMKSGVWGNLRSTDPPHSPAAWSTFVTGWNPGKHGILDFRRRAPGTYRSEFINGSHRLGQPFWITLNEYGYTVGIVNIPMTYPPDHVDGYFISGMDTPPSAESYVFPNQLKEIIPDYVVMPPDMDLDVRSGDYQTLWSKIYATLETRISTVSYLARTHPTDCLVVNFSATDLVQHHFWRFLDESHPQYDHVLASEYSNSILQVHRRLDTFLAEFLNSQPEDINLIVMSDHGFGPISNKALYLNRWLHQHGLLSFHPASKATALRRYVPRIIKRTLRALLPQQYGAIANQQDSALIDYEKSLAYADEFLGSIWINLHGRDPHGSVAEGREYEQLRQMIADGLQALHDPDTGCPVVTRVHRREEIYSGKMVETLPDLLVEPQWNPLYRLRPSYGIGGDSAVKTLTRAELASGDHIPGGVHRPMGIFLALGPDIRANGEIENIELQDLPPTILQLMRTPIPDTYDGRVLQEILTEDQPPRYFSDGFSERGSKASRYAEEDAQLLLERLRSLGYVD
jgi:predicted AlkP superfamily phosphohydrolase/phosphomutase